MTRKWHEKKLKTKALYLGKYGKLIYTIFFLRLAQNVTLAKLYFSANISTSRAERKIMKPVAQNSFQHFDGSLQQLL